jgi:hypothetical protein
MRKYLFLFLFLLIPSICFPASAVKTHSGVADSSVKTVSGIATASVKNCFGIDWNDGDAACSTPSGTILSESFGDGGGTTDATWTTNGDSYTYQHSLQAGSPSGSCTYGLLHDTANESGERIYWDNGSAIDYSTTNLDIEFSIYFNSFTMDASSNIWLVSWATANGGVVNYTGFVDIFYNGTNYYLQANGTAGNVQIATGTWYYIKMHIDTTAASSYLQVTGGGSTTCDVASECTFTRTDNSGRYLVIGSIYGEAATEAVSYEIGYITIN